MNERKRCNALIGFHSRFFYAISFHQFNLTRKIFQSAHFNVSQNSAFFSSSFVAFRSTTRQPGRALYVPAHTFAINFSKWINDGIKFIEHASIETFTLSFSVKLYFEPISEPQPLCTPFANAYLPSFTRQRPTKRGRASTEGTIYICILFFLLPIRSVNFIVSQTTKID